MENTVTIDQITKAHFVTLGFAEGYAKIFSKQCAGKTAYMAPDGTLFIGGREEIQAGDYFTAGRNTFGEGEIRLGYFAEYRQGQFHRVDLSDTRIISNTGNGYYSVTTHSPDKSRVAVSLYKNGMLAGTKLICHDLGGLELVYDASGVLSREYSQSLQNRKHSGFVITPLGDKGFRITSSVGKVMELTWEGHRLVTNPKMTRSEGYQDFKQYDVKQELILQIAGYQKTITLPIHNIYCKRSVLTILSYKGELSRITSDTDMFCSDESLVQKICHGQECDR